MNSKEIQYYDRSGNFVMSNLDFHNDFDLDDEDGDYDSDDDSNVSDLDIMDSDDESDQEAMNSIRKAGPICTLSSFY